MTALQILLYLGPCRSELIECDYKIVSVSLCVHIHPCIPSV